MATASSNVVGKGRLFVSGSKNPVIPNIMVTQANTM
jgi:hypothetical protein